MKTNAFNLSPRIVTILLFTIFSSIILNAEDAVEVPSIQSYMPIASAADHSNCIAVGHFISLGSGPTIGISGGNQKFKDASIAVDQLLKSNCPDKIKASFNVSDYAVSSGKLPKVGVSYIFFFVITPKTDVNYVVKALPNTDKNMQSVMDLLTKSQR